MPNPEVSFVAFGDFIAEQSGDLRTDISKAARIDVSFPGYGVCCFNQPLELFLAVSQRLFGQLALGYIVVSDDCAPRSEEHTSELQSQSNLVCRLLLEKKKEECRGGWGCQ